MHSRVLHSGFRIDYRFRKGDDMALPHKPGDHALVWNDEALAAPENFRLVADWAGESIGETVEIPNAYRGRLFGRNLSPAVSWSGLPDGTAQRVMPFPCRKAAAKGRQRHRAHARGGL